MLVCILLLLLRPFSLYEPVLRRMEIENHYTHTCILYYFFSVIKNKGDCYVSLKASELKCMFVFVNVCERERDEYMYDVLIHTILCNVKVTQSQLLPLTRKNHYVFPVVCFSTKLIYFIFC